LPAGETENTSFEIKPAKQIDSKSGKVLLVDKKSILPDSDGKIVEIGENIGAILNLKGKLFTGAAFVNEDLGVLPLADYEKLLKSIETK
jgi:hypothetical protein